MNWLAIEIAIEKKNQEKKEPGFPEIRQIWILSRARGGVLFAQMFLTESFHKISKICQIFHYPVLFRYFAQIVWYLLPAVEA